MLSCALLAGCVMTAEGEPVAAAIDGLDGKSWHLPLPPLSASSLEPHSPGEAAWVHPEAPRVKPLAALCCAISVLHKRAILSNEPLKSRSPQGGKHSGMCASVSAETCRAFLRQPVHRCLRHIDTDADDDGGDQEALLCRCSARNNAITASSDEANNLAQERILN